MTSIEQLILEMQELKKTKLYENSFKAIDDCIYLAYAKLETEKQQIFDAYNQGKHIACCGGYDITEKQYYNETFKNK